MMTKGALAPLLVLLGVAVGRVAAEVCTASNVVYGITFDQSGSIGKSNFAIEKGFVQDIITETNKNGAKFRITKFSTGVTRIFPNGNGVGSDTTANLVKLVSDTTYDEGYTAMDLALNDLQAQLPSTGLRICILITDGAPNRQGKTETESKALTTKAATDLKANGCTLITIGVGVSSSTQEYLEGIASSKSLFLYAAKFGDLKTVILPQLLKIACPTTCISTCTGKEIPSTPSCTGNCVNCRDSSSVVLNGASASCNRCLATGVDRCFWCVTAQATLVSGTTPLCSCCGNNYSCYDYLENDLVRQRKWHAFVLRCTDKYASTDSGKFYGCLTCLSNALTADPYTCTGDSGVGAGKLCAYP